MGKLGETDLSAVPVFFVGNSCPDNVLLGSVEGFVESLAGAEAVALDTETCYRPELELDGIPGKVRVISLGVRQRDGSEVGWVFDMRDIDPAILKPLLAGLAVDAWNANFDERALAGIGIGDLVWYDGMLADSLLALGAVGHRFHRGLATVAHREFGITLGGKGTTQLSYNLDDDLSFEQVRYAAEDSLITLRVCDVLKQRVENEGLSEAVALEQGARPMLNAMMTHGVPFDWEGYLETLEPDYQNITRLYAKLAELTDGGPQQTSLFPDENLMPGWQVTSAEQVKEALNRWDPDAVARYTGGRNLSASDTIGRTALTEIGGTLAETILAFRTSHKRVATYGENMAPYVRWEDGSPVPATLAELRNSATYQQTSRLPRLYGRYNQAIVTTGRFSSDEFNMQNLDPAMKKHLRCPNPELVFVYADLSQAEVRGIAHIAGDTDMAARFDSGEDFHDSTANRMFGLEVMEELRANNPQEADRKRSGAKGVTFGIPYGISGPAMAQDLRNKGVEVSDKEATEWLQNYYEANPKIESYLRGRDMFVAEIANNPAKGRIDWAMSMSLLLLRSESGATRSQIRNTTGAVPDGLTLAYAMYPYYMVLNQVQNGRSPQTFKKYLVETVATQQGLDPQAATVSDKAITEAEQHLVEKRYLELAASLDWAWSYDGAVVLCDDGTPFSFESRSPSGRRRLFQVPMNGSKFSGVITSFILNLFTTKNQVGIDFRDQYLAKHHIVVPGLVETGRKPDRNRLRQNAVKAFENKNARHKLGLVQEGFDTFGPVFMGRNLDKALADQIRALTNAFRNQPIQGVVADIMSKAFAEIYRQLPPGCNPVMTVHDSVTLIAPVDKALEVARMVKAELEKAERHYLPSVSPKADVDVRTSLDNNDVLYTLDENQEPLYTTLGKQQLVAA